MLGKVLVCGAAIPPSIKFFSIVNQLSRHKELAPLYDWALLHVPLLRTKKQDYKFMLFDVGKGADVLKSDLCVQAMHRPRGRKAPSCEWNFGCARAGD